MVGTTGGISFPVKLLPIEEELTCRSNQNLLDSCILARIPVAYNCRSGECGECIAKLCTGEVEELPGADPAVFSDTDRAEGKILLCMCFPRSAVLLDVRLRSDAPAIR